MIELRHLKKYRWCSHVELLSNSSGSFIERDEILALFGGSRKIAIRRYLSYLDEEGMVSNLEGGGLIRSSGGLREAVTLLREGQKINYDQRILGESDFASQVLEKKYDEPFKKCADSIDFDVLLDAIAWFYGITTAELLNKRRGDPFAEARSVAMYLAVVVQT